MLTPASRVKSLLRGMAEDNLVRNLDSGEEFTGFKGIYSLMPVSHISKNGYVYDLADSRECKHIIRFLKQLKKEASPQVTMTCGSFFSKNTRLRKRISKYLNILSQKGTVSVYAGGSDVKELFQNTVHFKTYDRNKRHIPHFIKSRDRFIIELPHTEKKQVRVDIISDTLDQEQKTKILEYLESLVTNFDNESKN